MLEEGKGASIDRAQAMQWYEKAAFAGKVFTMEHLAEMLRDDGKFYEAYVWAEVVSLRHKWLGPGIIKQISIEKFRKGLTADQLAKSKARAVKLDQEIPRIKEWMSW